MDRLERLEALSIVNMALQTINLEPIASGSADISKAERFALAFLDTARDAILEDHPWNFASVRAALTQSAAAPAFGFAYAYELPPDFIRLNTTELREPYSVIGRRLEIDRAPPCHITYVRRVTDPNQWPAMLRAVWAWRLADALAPALGGTEMTRLVKASEGAALENLSRAKRIDAQHQRLAPQRESGAFPWISARSW